MVVSVALVGLGVKAGMELFRLAKAMREQNPDATDEEIAEVWAKSSASFSDAVEGWKNA